MKNGFLHRNSLVFCISLNPISVSASREIPLFSSTASAFLLENIFVSSRRALSIDIYRQNVDRHQRIFHNTKTPSLPRHDKEDVLSVRSSDTDRSHSFLSCLPHGNPVKPLQRVIHHIYGHKMSKPGIGSVFCPGIRLMEHIIKVLLSLHSHGCIRFSA